MNDLISRKAVVDITAETGAWETQARVRNLPSADSWISCKYELPEHLKDVLVCTKNGVVIEAYYDEESKEWTITNNDSRIINVTHWQPLPEPPKGE